MERLLQGNRGHTSPPLLPPTAPGVSTRILRIMVAASAMKWTRPSHSTSIPARRRYALVDQGSGLQGVSLALGPHVPGRQPPQLLVHQRHEVSQRLLVSPPAPASPGGAS